MLEKNSFRSLSAFANYFSKQMEFFFEREYRLKVLLVDRKTNPQTKTALHAFPSFFPIYIFFECRLYQMARRRSNN